MHVVSLVLLGLAAGVLAAGACRVHSTASIVVNSNSVPSRSALPARGVRYSEHLRFEAALKAQTKGDGLIHTTTITLPFTAYNK